MVFSVPKPAETLHQNINSGMQEHNSDHSTREKHCEDESNIPQLQRRISLATTLKLESYSDANNQ
ncbi:hypothetical protein T4B_14921 [Trichinella pseudospiralis]|uniref:Uncharacterized protein n=1 Tax=Trichinella pseudospiralis TaxID=6337 RepID=A0A0V1EDM7_TRIPS|nr:hypothetical protein T4A_5693 [Trichinella pseudospiralis]KRZ13909.1 hypothetical protein T4B_14921 [Trichinella pseudospiralis]